MQGDDPTVDETDEDNDTEDDEDNNDSAKEDEIDNDSDLDLFEPEIELSEE